MVENTSIEAQKEQLLVILNKNTKRSFRLLPSTGMTKLLKAFTLDEIDSALAELVKDNWHHKRIKELSSEYLLRPTTIDKWFQIAERRPAKNLLNQEILVKL